jgi:hypothetical protein
MISSMFQFFLYLILILTIAHPAHAQTSFKHISTQYIVALGDPNANSGTDAQTWGLWRQDPGPRGCLLGDYDKLKASGGIAPAQWKFDNKDWWLEEHGSVMEKPDFPLPPGKYVVTGGREITTVLTIDPMDNNGKERWELDNGAKLYDVTHLPCHAARYTPATNDNSCSPAMIQKESFPVAPGVPMPPIKGCNKKEYAVLFVIGEAVTN